MIVVRRRWKWYSQDEQHNVKRMEQSKMQKLGHSEWERIESANKEESIPRICRIVVADVPEISGIFSFYHVSSTWTTTTSWLAVCYPSGGPIRCNWFAAISLETNVAKKPNQIKKFSIKHSEQSIHLYTQLSQVPSIVGIIKIYHLFVISISNSSALYLFRWSVWIDIFIEIWVGKTEDCSNRYCGS